MITLRLDTVYICHFTHTPAVPLTPVQSSHVDFILYVVLIVYVMAELTKWSITSAGIGKKKAYLCHNHFKNTFYEGKSANTAGVILICN